jgi:hypothetical protein
VETKDLAITMTAAAFSQGSEAFVETSARRMWLGDRLTNHLITLRAQAGMQRLPRVSGKYITHS